MSVKDKVIHEEMRSKSHFGFVTLGKLRLGAG